MQNSTPGPTQALSVEGENTEHAYLLSYSFYAGCEKEELDCKLLANAVQAALHPCKRTGAGSSCQIDPIRQILDRLFIVWTV